MRLRMQAEKTVTYQENQALIRLTYITSCQKQLEGLFTMNGVQHEPRMVYLAKRISTCKGYKQLSTSENSKDIVPVGTF